MDFIKEGIKMLTLNNSTTGRFKIKRSIDKIIIESGSDAIHTLLKLESQINYREMAILIDLVEIKINHDTPIGYHILEFYDSNGNGFEGGKTPSGYGITN